MAVAEPGPTREAVWGGTVGTVVGIPALAAALFSTGPGHGTYLALRGEALARRE